MPVGYKEIMTHISRAKASVAKLEAIRTLRELAEALRLILRGAVLMGREKFEIEILIDEVLRALSGMPEMQSMFPGGLSFRRGQEKELHERLSRTLEHIGAAIERAETDKLRARFNEIDRYLCQGQKLLEARNPIEARKAFRRCQERFPTEPGLNHDIGTRLLRSGLAAESIEYFEAAMAQDPRDPRPLAGLVQALEAVGETERALEMVKAIFRTFGANERVYLKLAEINHKLRRWDECYDAAKAACDLNPGNLQARNILKRVESRIFGG